MNETQPKESSKARYFYSLTFYPTGDPGKDINTYNRLIHSLAFLHKGEEEVPSQETLSFWGQVLCGATAMHWPSIMEDMALVSTKTPETKIMVYQVAPKTCQAPFLNENYTMKRKEDEVDLVLMMNDIYYFQNGKSWRDSMITMLPKWESKTERDVDYRFVVPKEVHNE